MKEAAGRTVAAGGTGAAGKKYAAVVSTTCGQG